MFFKKIIISLLVIFLSSVFSFAQTRPELKFTYVKVKEGDTSQSLFGDKWEIVSRINQVDERHLRPEMILKVPLDWELAREYPFFPKELTYEEDVPKLILVAIEEQFLAGYEYGQLKFWYPISSGTEKGLTPEKIIKEKGLHPTPRGRFRVLYKDKNHKSSVYPRPTGGQLMPFTIMFSWAGYALHAWGNPQYPKLSGRMPGYANSHGCLTLFINDAEKLFDWSERGTEVLIVDSVKSLSQLIIVEIEKRILRLYEDNKLIFEFPVGVGAKRKPTPIGGGVIYEKRERPIFRYTIGPKAGQIIWYSRLKDGRVIRMPYEDMRALAIFINNTDKYVIHSTTEEDSIGQAASSGCIRMKIKDMLILYPWVIKSCRIIIKP